MSNLAHAPVENGDANFDRIAKALLYLAANFRRQPSLDDAARVAGLSPFHFQREFTRMAGVSPKNFIAHLTLERAKHALLEGNTVLGGAFDAGLSGASRLHDLVLKAEAMTPGSYARRGAGVTIFYGWHPTFLGRALLAATEQGLCGVSFGAAEEREGQFSDMAARWPEARFVANESRIAPYSERLFARGGAGRIPVQLFGTPWQLKVWQALLAIPEGSAVAYGALAERLCSARAARATASAIARNPIAILIPCHRVIASTGALGGYRWGEARKRALLALEGARASEAA
jgi:AraC family transcriptional regulator, regulatory protein of adaptative response / methylated-DNA-[protein]-cysteine methyltransferase